MFPEKLPENPLKLFAEWFEIANNNKSIKQANAMALATSINNMPSLRMVLLKDYNENGFYFYTNLISRKAHELLENPHAAICFYWEQIDLQIRIEGNVTKTSDEKSDQYFASRPRLSKIGAWASKQSSKMDNDDDLVKQFEYFKQKFADTDIIPRPDFWSGFCIKPTRYEFWEQGENRIHNRYAYTNNADNWQITKLFP